ncbi:MAG TPA: T9SS type A sorting domain-containing protein, partial [Flavisolibacter sp.]|nr:T9SS type A sorting domain-containing protein [Flavisolibacter sp.]
NSLASFDLLSGSLTNWNPNVNNTVRDLSSNGNTIYAGGAFTDIGNISRNYIAAFDAATGVATNWNPGANGEVYSLTVTGQTIYAGGDFTIIGGAGRDHIAAMEAGTGNSTAWDPAANGIVETITINGNRVYAGGQFTAIGGANRNHLASLNVAGGQASDWNPDADNTIHAVLVKQNSLFAGGDFTTIQGTAHPYLAVFENVNIFPLPVFLLSFTAKVASVSNQEKVVCNWKTVNEENSSFFLVERSTNARNFIAIGKINSHGNSSSLIDYSYTDETPLSGLSYYRLKMVDLDGSFNYSSIVAITISSNSFTVLVQQNPFGNELNLLVSSPLQESLYYKLTDAAGREYIKGYSSLINGMNSIPIATSFLSPGIYFLSTYTAHGSQITRLLKQ